MDNEQYFNIEIQIDPEGVATAAIYKRDGRDVAITNFHNSMASMRLAVDSGTLKEVTGMVINSWGGVESPYCEHYYIPVPEPIPNVEG